MKRIRITGLVHAADQMRQALAQPLSSAERLTLAGRLQDSLHQVEAILAQHNARPEHLPPPSLRAYRFLKELSAGALLQQATMETTGDGGKSAAPANRAESTGRFAFPGLRAYHERLLDSIAAAIHACRIEFASTIEVIHNTRRRLDHLVAKHHITPARLQPTSRDLLTWYRWFGEAKHLTTYVETVRRAQSMWDRLPRIGGRPPILVHFRPLRKLYQWREVAGGVRIVLPVPFIALDDATLLHLGRLMAGLTDNSALLTRVLLGDACQALARQIDALVPYTPETRGMAYDLAAVFDCVNRTFFSGAMPQPGLVWTRKLTGRTFGRYDFVSDTVAISSSLDRPDAPAFVIEYVMYHELLHKKHGIAYAGGRQHVHTTAFRAEERLFPQFQAADAVLAKISRQ